MFTQATTRENNPTEAALLAQAAAGDPGAAEDVLNRLSSANPWLRQIMATAIQGSADLRLWQRLLACLATHRWDGREDCQRRAEHEASERIDAAITGLFVEDEGPEARLVKIAVLHEGLTDPECRVRSTAAILLGLRGDARAVETLIETVRSGEARCRLQAVAALRKLKDERAAWALAEALASDDEALHTEASHALGELRGKALPALLETLKSPKQHVRWHGVCALGAIGSGPAMAGLAEALADDDYGVRWAAADALAALGGRAVPAILDRLSRSALTEGLRQAAYHALNRLQSPELRERLEPVLAALHGQSASAEAPVAAYRLLQTWEGRR